MEFRFIDPASDFANGMDVLRVYHDDLLAQGGKLLTLAKNIYDHGVNKEYAQQCIDFHSYFMRANKLHHQDEEYALFPLIIRQSALVDGMIERLVIDHLEIEKAWDELAAFLENPEQIRHRNQFLVVAGEFEKIQREHLQRENEDFLGKAQRLLSHAQRVQMGWKMAALRGLDYKGGARLAV